MLEALRQCEPEMPTLIDNNDEYTNASVTMEFFTESTTMGIQQQATMTNNVIGRVEDDISSTSSPLAPIISLSTANTVVHTLAELYDRELVNIIGWAKQIPGI